MILRPKRPLNEEFNIKTGMMQGNGGKYFPVAYIEGDDKDNTFQHKDKIKKTYGAQWLRNVGNNGAWGWFLPDSEEGKQKAFNSKIKPCLEYLMSVETTPENGIVRDIDKAIAELQSAVESGPKDVIEQGVLSSSIHMSKAEIEEQLNQFKQDIVNSLNSDELKQKLDQIAKWKGIMGSKLSSSNLWYALVQDREATDVRSIGKWKALNRELVPNAKVIGLFVPRGNSRFKGKEEKKKAKEEFLRQLGKTEDQLTPGEKERLKDFVNQNDSSFGFAFRYNFVDVRFTKQIEGKEEIYQSRPELEWFNENAEEGEKYEMLINAAFEVAREEYGLDIQVKSQDELGGARGYATSQGEIAFLDNYKKNSDTLSTVIHEISHQLLHHNYAQSKNEELKQFYLGRGSRELIEQQAEICAYIVMRQFGVTETMKYNINYVVGWGTNETNAVKVFDMVANTSNDIASRIINRINNESETPTEDETEIDV